MNEGVGQKKYIYIERETERELVRKRERER